MYSATVRVFALAVALLMLPNMGLRQSTLEAWLITLATGDVATVAIALAAGADPNARDDEGRSAVALAAAYNPDPAVVRHLIEAGVNPNAPVDTSESLSALMVTAARTPDIAVIRKRYKKVAKTSEGDKVFERLSKARQPQAKAGTMK